MNLGVQTRRVLGCLFSNATPANQCERAHAAVRFHEARRKNQIAYEHFEPDPNNETRDKGPSIYDVTDWGGRGRVRELADFADKQYW